MRYLAATTTLALLIACTLPAAQGPTSLSPSPTVSPTIDPTASPATPTPTADVVLKANRVRVPAEFRYIVPWSSRILLLDLEARTSTEVATLDWSGSDMPPGYPVELLSASRDGRVLLLTVALSPTNASAYLLRPETGDVRLLARGPLARGAIVSQDGTRFAISRNDQDRALTGLWIGTTADGAMRRLIADDPQFSGSPPIPYAFSNDGAQLAFGLGEGPPGHRAGLLPVSSPELTVDRSGAGTLAGVTLLGWATGAEFAGDRELFVWSTQTLLGGETLAYSHDLGASRTAELYRPNPGIQISEAAWRPGAAEFAVIERPECCGINRPGTLWLRGRGGSVRRVRDVAGLVGQMWWSRDGSKLYALVGGDDSTGGVIDLLSGAGGMSFCRRGGMPGGCV